MHPDVPAQGKNGNELVVRPMDPSAVNAALECGCWGRMGRQPIGERVVKSEAFGLAFREPTVMLPNGRAFFEVRLRIRCRPGIATG